MVKTHEADATSASLDETELVRRARSGDGRAFDELVSRYESAIYTLARRILRHTEDAEDATQDAFMSVMEHLNELRDPSDFGPWLRRIAARSALQILRRRPGTVSVDDPFRFETEAEPPPDLPDFIAPWRKDPHTVLERTETRRLLQEALDELSPDKRSVFVLRDVEGFSVGETAELTGLTEANVKVLLLRARLKLRERLTRAFGDPSRRVHRPDYHNR